MENPTSFALQNSYLSHVYICHVLGKNDEKSFAILDDIGWQLNGNCSPIAAGMGMTLLSRNWPCTIFCCVWQPKK